jgi:hypothetical protein
MKDLSMPSSPSTLDEFLGFGSELHQPLDLFVCQLGHPALQESIKAILYVGLGLLLRRVFIHHVVYGFIELVALLLI